MIQISLISMILSLVLVFSAMFMVLSSMFLEGEKTDKGNTYFECGVESPSAPLRVPFVIHFYLVLVIFLIFDIEFVILIPAVFFADSWNIGFLFFFFTFLFLAAGFFVEVQFGSIDWKE